MLFSFYFYFFILKGAPAPSFYFGTPDGGYILLCAPAAIWLLSIPTAFDPNPAATLKPQSRWVHSWLFSTMMDQSWAKEKYWDSTQSPILNAFCAGLNL